MFAVFGWFLLLLFVGWFGILMPFAIVLFGAAWTGRFFDTKAEGLGFSIWVAMGATLTYNVWIAKPFVVVVGG